MFIPLKILRNLNLNHYDIKEKKIYFSVLCLKHVIGKKKASKMRIMTRHSGIEMAYLKVVIDILKLNVGAAKGELIPAYNLYRIRSHSLEKYSILALS